LDQGVEDGQEFSRGRHQGGHLGFAVVQEALIEVADSGIDDHDRQAGGREFDD
jgi:hypothetical protein